MNNTFQKSIMRPDANYNVCYKFSCGHPANLKVLRCNSCNKFLSTKALFDWRQKQFDKPRCSHCNNPLFNERKI